MYWSIIRTFLKLFLRSQFCEVTEGESECSAKTIDHFSFKTRHFYVYAQYHDHQLSPVFSRNCWSGPAQPVVFSWLLSFRFSCSSSQVLLLSSSFKASCPSAEFVGDKVKKKCQGDIDRRRPH